MKPHWAYVVLIALYSQLAIAAQPLEPRSFDQIQVAVGALKKPDVAWRKIDWKTCLLEGLNASREQKKPVILWIFIDRPIDDERC